MYISTQAIVLNTIKYTDSKNIAVLFTREYGLLSAMCYVRANKKSIKALLQPLSIVEVVLKRGNNKMFFMSDVVSGKIFNTIPFDPQKRVVAISMAEILYRTIKEEHQDILLYDFMNNYIVSLDEASGNILGFITLFLLEYGRMLGIYPDISTYEKGSVFDMNEGVFCQMMNIGGFNVLSRHNSRQIVALMNTNINKILLSEYPSEDMKETMDTVVKFLEIHLPDIKKVKSLEVLKTIL